MIVDVHTHLPTHRTRIPPSERRVESVMRSGTPVQLSNTIADYAAAMKPTDRTLIFGIAPRPWAPDRNIVERPRGFPAGMNHNDIAAEVARKFPDKVVGCMSLHPLDPKLNEEYDRCVGDLKLRGIKLGPNYQDFDPHSDAAFRLFARLEKDGIPIVFHQGTSPMWDAPLEYAHPLKMDRIATCFPKLRIVMAHLGHPWQADCLAVVRKHKNVWADVSAQFYRPYSFWQGMRLFYEWGVTGKILFASDWPVTRPQDNIDGLRGLAKFAGDHKLPAIPEKEIEGIINRDALDILGLD
ncbi:MAG: amidohydrolase [Chloroflexi bacterium]|nr:amidohydrolase [Chloroflexota bacterium]